MHLFAKKYPKEAQILPLSPTGISSTKLTLLVSCFLVALYNTAYFKALYNAVPIINLHSALFFLSNTLLLFCATSIVISLFIASKITKPALAFIFIAAASTSYFMNTYGIVIHQTMIQNMAETDTKEAKNLISPTLAIYILILGIIPSTILFRANIRFNSFKNESLAKIKLWAVAIVFILLLIAPFSADYASLFRNHKDIRQKANPSNFIYATLSYLSSSNKSISVKPIGEDAKVDARHATHTKPTLFILVVGETARADHFSINGYPKDTTPLLSQQDIINYSQVFSCGTETAVSLPCMFSNLSRHNYSDKKAKAQEGLLDVIKHSGYSVLWRDNNSGCKGTCARVEAEYLNSLKIPELCNEQECFDNILLHNIDEKTNQMPGNKVIVLHQAGSHGPDYYRRYPANMEVFKPTCKVNTLQDCSSEEINNAFDNTIHMTDQFLNNTINWLKQQSAQYNTALIYLSDHGESLGENNIYLHGMPYLLAPVTQKHVPFFFWFSAGFELENNINRTCLSALTNTEYSHDNLFHTTLGLLNINTSLYNPDLDMTHSCRP